MTTWNWDDNYESATLERETPHGRFRARIEREDFAVAPYCDFGCPVYRYELTGYGVRMESRPEYGQESDKHAGIDFSDALEHFNERTRSWRDTLRQLDRWLRIFHGGGLREVDSTVHRGDPYYLTFDTRAMREFWGQTGDRLETSDPEADEWQAYIDGEVYGIIVEHATFDEDGEVESWDEAGDGFVWGHYGEDWAKQAATEELDAHIERVAGGMLPLEGAA